MPEREALAKYLKEYRKIYNETQVEFAFPNLHVLFPFAAFFPSAFPLLFFAAAKKNGMLFAFF